MKTTSKTLSLFLLSLLVFCSLKCEFNSNEKIALKDLAGQWLEQENPDKIQFSGTNYHFEILEDHTFRLKLRHWTDAIDPNSSCTNNRIDYIKGTFEITDNLIKFIGLFSDQSFEHEQANCKGEGTFTFESEVQFKEDALLMTDPNGQRIRMIRP